MHPLIRSYFLLFLLGRLVLLALPFLLGICLSFTAKSTLSSSCSRSDLPHSRQGAALAHLDSFLPPPMIWYSRQTALFLIHLARAAPAFLPTAHFVALRPLFPFRQAQYDQVFWLKPAPFCTLFAGLNSTNKRATSLLLISDSRSVLATLSSLSSCIIRLQWVPGHSFLPGNNSADELARRGALLALSAIPCSLSPLISRIHSCHISDWRRTVSSKFFDFHRGTCAPSSCSLCSILSTLQRTQPTVRFLSR